MAPQTTTARSAENNGQASKLGWNSPSYTQSQSVTLDPGQLIARRCIAIEPESPEIEHYKLLRTQVQQRTRDKGWNTVMVTSPNPGEGKTVTDRKSVG